MKKSNSPFSGFSALALLVILFAVLFFQSCGPDDPDPVNEEEVITTLEVVLTPSAAGTSPVTLKFLDADGEQGSAAPVVSVSGPLRAATLYTAVITFLNETVSPPEDITLEVEEEGDDHLICFETSSNITIAYEDTDDRGLPLGLETSWLTGEVGPAEVTVSLRHQAGTKTGDCPGGGETDVEVAFEVIVE